jgi:hypothetical protein
MGKAAFTLGGAFPPVVEGVTLHKGWFKDTLGSFLKSQAQPHVIAGMNVDNDLYMGALEVLVMSQPFMVNDTVIHFHELRPKLFQDWPSDEARALFDFLLLCPGTTLELLPISARGVQEPAVFYITSAGSRCDLAAFEAIRNKEYATDNWVDKAREGDVSIGAGAEDSKDMSPPTAKGRGVCWDIIIQS